MNWQWKFFFDEICSQIFKGNIDYNSISLANILKSPHEAELMLQAEEYMNKGKYNFALYITQVTVIYHYMLVKTNLFLQFYRDMNYTVLPDSLATI